MKTLWVVSGGAEAVPGVKKAREMGLFVVVSDADPKAPAAAVADDFVLASTYDTKATVEAALLYHQTKRSLDGVVCIAADVPLTVAMVAEAIGLPGIPVSVAVLAADKLAMKQRFVEKGVPVPWFSQVESAEYLQGIIAEKGLPLVVKPVDSRGARGVLRLTEDVDPVWAYHYALSFSPSGRVMVEEYLEGPQISTESLLLSGKGVTPGFADRNYEYIEQFAPYIIENGGEQPSILSLEQKKAVSQCAEQAALAMGIENGVAKGDLVLTDSGPKVIEVAARLSGGWFSTDQIPLGTGVDLVGAVIRQSLGKKVEAQEVTPVFVKGIAIRYFFPPSGKLIKIEGAERFADKDWVHKIGFFVRPGDRIDTATNHTQRVGFVITVGNTRGQAVRRAQVVVDGVKWHVES